MALLVLLLSLAIGSAGGSGGLHFGHSGIAAGIGAAGGSGGATAPTNGIGAAGGSGG